MLDDYLQLLDYDGYSDSKYKDNAAKAVAGENIDSRKVLIEMIDNAIAKAKKNAEPSPSSSGGGGSSSSSERPVSVPAPIVKDEAVEETGERVVFSDVTESHWAFEAINYLRWEGIVNGSDFNCYYPENTVTRCRNDRDACSCIRNRKWSEQPLPMLSRVHGIIRRFRLLFRQDLSAATVIPSVRMTM